MLITPTRTISISTITIMNQPQISLIPCASVEERNLLADAAKIVEKNSKVYKRKEDLIKFVSENLQSLEFMAAAAKQSLKKTGMHVPSWRKRDYMLAKWISPSAARSTQVSDAAVQETMSSEVVVDADVRDT
ncbi:unnamed protein product [Trifolium pratense]|uniref:Uncharacterized protein n=1 Tax=Trifolium pratense TaxID=57577 RepID=A0ACB0JRV0_TRIPR|nr:unnamed protein product [Trifolium pratense]